jgi:hypothetical protein
MWLHLYVTWKLELVHLNGHRLALLAANVLSQNHSFLHSHKQASKAQQMSPACHVVKQELVGCCAPAQQVFLSRKASWPDRPSSENPSGETGEVFFNYDDFPMSEAGPSGVHHDSPSAASPRTINLDESLLAWHSPTPITVTQGLPPHSSPMPLADDTDGHDQYSLLTGHRSCQIAQCIERIGQVYWGTNHVQFIKQEERRRK